MAAEDGNPSTLLVNGDMSGNIISPNVVYPGCNNIGLQFVWTGTPTGSFFVDISLNGTDWTPLPLDPAPVAAGAAGNNYVELAQSSPEYLRCRYVAGSGTGSLTILVIQKII
jgi:hypothetical protein